MIQEQSQATFAEYKTQIYTYASKMVQLLYLSPLCCTGSTLHGTAWNIGYIQLSQRKEYSTETVRSSCIHCYSIGILMLMKAMTTSQNTFKVLSSYLFWFITINITGQLVTEIIWPIFPTDLKQKYQFPF